MRRDSEPVWDPLIRTFHWMLVTCVVAAYAVEDDVLRLHTGAGGVVAGLLFFRLIWGFVGTRHARFSDFVPTPARLTAHLRGLLSGHPHPHAGHTPAGGAMIVALLAVLALLIAGGTALLAVEENAGPLAEWLADAPLGVEAFLEATHGPLADALMIMALIHVGGVAVESLLQRENLVRAMITGRKRSPRETEVA